MWLLSLLITIVKFIPLLYILGRFVDISVDVRKEMIECGFMILKHKHGVATVVAEVEDCMCQRLRDTEWEVRYQALAR